MTWFTDMFGTTFTTGNGQAPSFAGTSVTIANPNGTSTPGTWNGSQAK